MSFRRVPFDYEAFRADQLSTGLKHKSWFLKLIDSQAQDIAPMGDMTARPTSLVTGHINRSTPLRLAFSPGQYSDQTRFGGKEPKPPRFLRRRCDRHLLHWPDHGH